MRSVSIDGDGISQVHIRPNEGDMLGIMATDMQERMALGETTSA